VIFLTKRGKRLLSQRWQTLWRPRGDLDLERVETFKEQFHRALADSLSEDAESLIYLGCLEAMRREQVYGLLDRKAPNEQACQREQ